MQAVWANVRLQRSPAPGSARPTRTPLVTIRSTSRTYNHRWCKSPYEQYGLQISYSASIMTKVGSTRRGTACSTGLANSVVKVVARRWQRTASSGGMQIHAPIGVVLYFVAWFVRVAYATTNRSALKQFLRHWHYEYYSGMISRVEFGNGAQNMGQNR